MAGTNIGTDMAHWQQPYWYQSVEPTVFESLRTMDSAGAADPTTLNSFNFSLSVAEISQETAVNPVDIVSTLQSLQMLKYWKGKHLVLKRQVKNLDCCLWFTVYFPIQSLTNYFFFFFFFRRTSLTTGKRRRPNAVMGRPLTPRP